MATKDEDVQRARSRVALTVYVMTVLGTLAWLGAVAAAPYLRSRGHGAAASLIYAVFSPVCHQIPARSFHWAGFPMAVCGRCLGIYAGFLAGLLAFPPVERLSLKSRPGSGLLRDRLPKARVFLAFSFPMALDFAAGLLGLWNSTNAVRFATGAVWGALLPFYFLPGVLGLFARRAVLANRAAKP